MVIMSIIVIIGYAYDYDYTYFLLYWLTALVNWFILVSYRKLLVTMSGHSPR